MIKIIKFNEFASSIYVRMDLLFRFSVDTVYINASNTTLQKYFFILRFLSRIDRAEFYALPLLHSRIMMSGFIT
jgi:hypothetical protein